MNFDFNPSLLQDAIYNILNNDATLQQSDYLKSSNKIFRSRAPRTPAPVAPYIVEEILELIPDDMGLYKSEIRLHIYLALLSNGQIDVTAGHRIVNRCEILLNNVTPALTEGVAMPLITLGVVPMMYDTQADDSKAKTVLRLEAEVSKQ
jgi:hypothetical protein